MAGRSSTVPPVSCAQVLIAGGGPVGLAAAVELGKRGISCLVVEPRETVSRARPRCKTVNVRSMEHLRRWGIADRLRSVAPLSTSWSQDIVFCTSLAGHELSRFTGVFGLIAEGDRFPELGQQAPQFVLEDLLREVVGELPACELWLGARVVAVEQDDSGVRATVVDEAGGEAIVAGEYLLGCDGPRSAVRDAIGSRYVGDVALRPNFGLVFRSPELWGRVRHGPAVQYWIVNDASPGVVGPLDLDGTWWLITVGVDRETGERDAQQLIAAATGTSVSAEVLSTDPWTARMQLVDRSRRGRVFLAGDAAHLNPPWGGHGLNTGLGDAVDLGWKLAAVLDGWGGPGLLASYERERRPVQARVIAEAEANMSVLSSELLSPEIEAEGAAGEAARRLAHARIQETKYSEFHALDLVLGIGYEQSPIIALDGRGTASNENPARPGFRLPHAWLPSGQSIFDELGPGLTLLSPDGREARESAVFEDACRARNVPLRALDLAASGLGSRYGARLILVRPDQHVAWCGDGAPDDAGALIDHVCGVS